MKSDTHTPTPGPWHVFAKNGVVEVWGADRSSKNPVIKWTGFDGCDHGLEIQKANAHLIAAAPEMYEALVRLVSVYEWRHDDSHAARLEYDSIARDAVNLLTKARALHYGDKT